MTQRNPMNERYQDSDKKAGTTRKSAASAKPVSKAASSVRIEGGASSRPQGRFARAQRRAQVSKNRKQELRKRQQDDEVLYYRPASKAYHMWRRIWWVLIFAAIILTAVSFITPRFTSNTMVSYVLLATGYAALVGAIVVEIAKVRKIRNREIEEMGGMRSKKARAWKKAEEARRAEERATKEAAKMERSKKKLFGFNWKK